MEEGRVARRMLHKTGEERDIKMGKKNKDRVEEQQDGFMVS